MVAGGQLVDRNATADSLAGPLSRQDADRAARRALSQQIARLEIELSRIVAEGFPHIPIAPVEPQWRSSARLLALGELERHRDRLFAAVQHARGQASQRRELELRSLDLLERMKLEPRRYKFVRLPLEDLGQGKCGAWEVRPKWGLLGMLAGWWELKLSSGCPLPRGRAPARPAPR
jgi:hypothetical protein